MPASKKGAVTSKPSHSISFQTHASLPLRVGVRFGLLQFHTVLTWAVTSKPSQNFTRQHSASSSYNSTGCSLAPPCSSNSGSSVRVPFFCHLSRIFWLLFSLSREVQDSGVRNMIPKKLYKTVDLQLYGSYPVRQTEFLLLNTAYCGNLYQNSPKRAPR